MLVAGDLMELLTAEVLTGVALRRESEEVPLAVW
jgi:hypothetical protein